MDEGKEASAQSGLPRPSQGLGPLAGVRVLELATVIMTPYTGQLLGDLGADVVKVEHGSLDSSRVMGGGPHRELSGVALNLHRNKRSVSLDIKTEGGREVFDRLLDDSDVLLTNLRPGPLRRLHLSYDDVSPSRPSLVYCQSQGFATGTTEEDRPAYDDIVQALAGLPYLNQQVLGTMAFFPSLIGDKIAGLMIAYGVLGALVHRCLTGEGQQVEVPMFDSLLSFGLVEHLSRAATPGEPAGYSRIMTEHRGPHRTRDGFIAMMPYTDAHWKSLFLAVDRLDILDRPWFVDHRSRLLRAEEVYRDLAEIITERTTEEWLSLCRMHDIPASPVPTLDQIIEDPANHRGVLSEANHPVVGTYRSIQSPVRYSATPTSMRRHAPLVAEHTDEILVELGYAPDEIATLVEAGAIRCRLGGPAST